MPAQFPPDLNESSLQKLRDIVAGRDHSGFRMQAMAILRASDFPDKHLDFEAVLQNEAEPPRLRTFAAMNLSRINTPAALDILVKNSRTTDPQVLSGILVALGRIGDRSALAAVEEAQPRVQGWAAVQAGFAAALISHRLGLAGHDLPIPAATDFYNIPIQKRMDFPLAPAAEVEAEFCLRSLAGEPFGVEFSREGILQGRTNECIWMLLFNRDFTGKDGAAKLTQRKALWGVIASRPDPTDRYSTAFLLLTVPAPRPNAFHILIHHPNADLAFAGKAVVSGQQAEITIRSVNTCAIPIRIDGTYAAGRFTVRTAQTALLTVKKRQPIPDSIHALQPQEPPTG